MAGDDEVSELIVDLMIGWIDHARHKIRIEMTTIILQEVNTPLYSSVQIVLRRGNLSPLICQSFSFSTARFRDCLYT